MSVWDVLIGQDEAIDVLRAAAAAGQEIAGGREAKAGAMTHAWLFTGPPGSGRSVAARALAAALQCTSPTMDGPGSDLGGPGCGECQGCHTTLAGTHPDVKVINPEGLSIGVDAMRAVVASSGRRPALGSWQVIIIEDADRLTEGASNALLKAIEEPPSRTVFLLCAPSTHPDDVSVTIRSRCRGVTLHTPSVEAIAAVLLADGYDAASVAWIAPAAQGHVGRARRLSRDEQSRARRASVLAIPASLTSMQACFDAADALLIAADEEADAAFVGRDAEETEALKTALGMGGTGKGAVAAGRGAAGQVKELEKRQKSRATRTKRDVLDRALVDLAGFYRDVLMVQLATGVPGANPDFAASVAQVAGRLSHVQTLERLDAVLGCREALDLNVKPRIAVEAMTFALRLPAQAGWDS
jgi:DNA polymerase-3 subunit delta'